MYHIDMYSYEIDCGFEESEFVQVIFVGEFTRPINL